MGESEPSQAIDGNVAVVSLILEALKKGEQSISSVHRRLQEKGLRLHRLETTGYLKAMMEVGILRLKIIPPSHVFYIPSDGPGGER